MKSKLDFPCGMRASIYNAVRTKEGERPTLFVRARSRSFDVAACWFARLVRASPEDRSFDFHVQEQSMRHARKPIAIQIGRWKLCWCASSLESIVFIGWPMSTYCRTVPD